MEIFSAFGIDWRLFLVQLVNFFILLYVLKHFAYAPMLKVLEDRRAKIEKGLSDAEKANVKLIALEEKEKQTLADARREAKNIIVSAEQSAQKMSGEIIEKTQEKARDILEQAKKQIEFEKQKMVQDVRKEIGQLVVMATKKIVGIQLDPEKDREIIDRSIT